MQRRRPNALPSIAQQQNTGQPMTANNNGPSELFIEGALSRFQQRMDRMLSIMETGFESLILSQSRTSKRLGRISSNLEALTKHFCESAADSQTNQPSRRHKNPSLVEEDHHDEQMRRFAQSTNSRQRGKESQAEQQRGNLAGFASLKTNRLDSMSEHKDDEQPALSPQPIVEKTQHQHQELILQLEEQLFAEMGKQPTSQVEIGDTLITTNSLADNVLAKFGEYRDHIILLPIEDPIDGKRLTGKQSPEELKAFLCKWIGRVADLITKETFHGYYNKEMNEQEMRVFLCNHMILAFHQMVAYLKKHYPAYWSPYKQQLIFMYQEQLTLALEYYLVKYPQKNKVFLNAQLRDLILEKDEVAFPQFNILNRLEIRFNPLDPSKILSKNPQIVSPKQMDYTKTMKEFINALIGEAKSWNEEFKTVMQKIFTISGEQEGKPLKDFQLSMKFKEDTAPFSDEEIRNPGVPIHSPEVLRILIKWIEELDSMLRQPEKNILEKGEEVGGRSQIETLMLSRYNKELASLIMEHYHKEFDENSTDRSIMDSAYNSLHDYVRHHRPQFNYLPETTVSCGMTVNLMSTLTCDIAVLYLQKLIGFFYQMHVQCMKKVGQQGTNFLKFDQELLPFSVCDLLRARCSCTMAELEQVLNNLQGTEGVNIVRVKNRLETGNRDFLINFTFGECRLICEVQVGLKDTADEKGSCLHHFNHFLYELRRSKFGPLSESALIIGNIIDVGAYFRKKTGSRKSVKDILKFSPIVNGLKVSIEGYEMLKPNFTFLCNNCLQSCSNRVLAPWKNVRQDEYLCGKCVYYKLNAQERAVYALGQEIGPFFQQIDWKIEQSKKSDYIAVLTSETLAKIDFFSTKEPEGAVASTKNVFGELSKDIYYQCFGDMATFYPVKNFKNHKIYKLRSEFAEVVLRPNQEVPQSNKGAWTIDIVACMEDLPQSKEKLPYLKESSEQTKFKVCYAPSSSQQYLPDYFDTVKCAVDTARRRVFLLDVDRDSFTYMECREYYIQTKLQNRNSSNQWQTEWNYDKRNFQDELLMGMPDDDAVESIKMSYNLFTRLDILKSSSLKKLYLNHNKISNPIAPEAHYPSLQQLSLIGNNISVLDFTVLVLPYLEILDVSVNRIEKIILVRTADNSKTGQATLSYLKNFNLRFNNLTEFGIVPTDFPEIENLAVSFNQIEELDLTGFKCLKEFRGSYMPLNSLTISGEYPKLEGLYFVVTNLKECNLSQAITPKLTTLYFSYNKLSRIEMPRSANDLATVILCYNYLTELTLGKPGGQDYPKLKELYLQCNLLRKLDITALGSCPAMQNLNISYNDDMKLIASPALDILKGFLKRHISYQTEEVFNKWMIFQSSKEHQAAFKQKFFQDNPTFPLRVWENHYGINDPSYTKSMDMESSENSQNIGSLNQIWKAFKKYHHTNIESDPSSDPIYANLYKREAKEYSFLRPKKEGDGNEGELEEMIPTFTIPLGDRCSDCNKVLTIPYYYGVTSRKHRCRQCCEKENEGYANPLERYAINQNSILFMGDRVVDVSRIGSDIQPKSDKECQQHNMACNGCRGTAGNKARYICFGCRREPSNLAGGYIDFCHTCMNKLAGTNEADRETVMKFCKSEGHKTSHSLLRVLFKVVDYYKY